MAMQLRDSDISTILNFVQTGQIRDASGFGNNTSNPTWGAATQPFIRLTNPFYTDGAAGLRTTTNTPRQISDIVSNQDNNNDGVEESIPNAFGGSALLTFFGQYFDHGLDFVGKGGSGTVQIGSGAFPITASRARIAPGTGVDPDGIPNNGDEIAAQYINTVSPYADQNQTYGSHDAVTDLLRKWEAGPNGAVKSAYLLMGDADGSGRALLPTLDHVRANYRVMTGGNELTSEDISNYDGTGHSLLLDFIPSFVGNNPANGFDLDKMGHYYIAGDGRVNENVMLTSIHVIWARNHNFWVDHLKARTGGAWTEEEYFQAARIINVAEYQNVIFGEFADVMAGGIVPGDPAHGFVDYDTTVDASISAEFAHSAYRFGHSMLNETVSFKNAGGSVGSLSLVQAFLSPEKLGKIGVEELLLGATGVRHQAIDVDVVNALRNQLVGQPLDLAALNIFRGRDTGIAPFNAVRAELFAKTGLESLRPYTGWADFQAKNQLSASFVAQLQQAYPGQNGFNEMDLWVGGLAERPTRGQLGSTFGHIFIEQLDRLQDGDRFYYLDILDNSLFASPENIEGFGDIVMRNTGITGLPSNVFLVTPNGSTSGSKIPDPVPPGPIVGTARSETLVGTAGNDVVKAGGGNDTVKGLDGNDQLYGEAGNDYLIGGNGHDRLYGEDGSDRLHGGTGYDLMWGGQGNDVYYVDSSRDRVYEGRSQGIDTVASSISHSLSSYVEKLVLSGTGNIRGNGNALDNTLVGNAGRNILSGGGGRDVLKGMAGHDKLYGGADNDSLLGGIGNDMLYGGSGNDRLFGGPGNDWLYGNIGRDIFVFERGGGTDRIKDFRIGQDLIDARQPRGVDDISDLRIAQSGSHAVIRHGSDVLVVENVKAGMLSSSDFLL